jgi:hypothetical protein
MLILIKTSLNGVDDRRIGVRFPAGIRYYVFSVASRQILEPNQPPIQRVPNGFLRGNVARE